jgi:hypothetical protein
LEPPGRPRTNGTGRRPDLRGCTLRNLTRPDQTVTSPSVQNAAAVSDQAFRRPRPTAA